MKTKFPVPLSDLGLFLIVLLINGSLAYAPFPFTFKLWIALLGSLTIWLWLRALPIPPFPKKFTLRDKETLPGVSFWVWFLPLFLALFFRFYKLTTLSTWPYPDEAVTASLAYQLTQNWDWHFFYAYSQSAFPYFWGLAALFKVFSPSLKIMWLFPAVTSTLYIPFGYLAARSFFSRSFSILTTVVLALSYWGLYAGRLGIFVIPFPLAELTVLCLFGWFLNSPTQQQSQRQVSLLALGLGVGFYFHPLAWAPLALFIALSVLKVIKGRRETRAALLFIAVLMVSLIPLIMAMAKEHFGTYLFTLTPGSTSRWNLHQFLVSASYVTGLFWGKTRGDYYGPVWGGFFDPLSSTLFFVGLIHCWRHQEKTFLRWTCLALLFTLSPGLFSDNLEFFRIFLAFPLIVVLAAKGLEALVLRVPTPFRNFWIAALLAVIAALNLYHLLGPYQDSWKNPGPTWSFYKSPEKFKAYQILKKTAEEKGPGCLFLHFENDMSDQTTAIASFGFNTAANARLDPSQSRWFAILTNDDYGPFLLERFPRGNWYPLAVDLNRLDGGLGLGIFPVDSMDASTRKHWLEANLGFQKVTLAFLNRPTGTSYSKVLQTLLEKQGLIQNDPFLASSFWERAYYLYLQNSAFGDKQKGENFRNAFQSLREALDQGYPAAHLYNEYGTCLLYLGQTAEARKAYEKAVKANPHFTLAQENLHYLLAAKAHP